MFPNLRLILIIIILIAPAACKEVAYVYGEGGGRALENINFSERNESEILTYTVSSIGSTSKSYETNNTTSEIKEKIKQKINKGNRSVRTKGRILVGTISGASRIDQICSIYDSLVSVRNWTYIGDWTGLEELQSSDETLELGASSGILGKGDCDDFAILLAALIESVQGTSRIVFAYGPVGGHAYAQVYLGRKDTENVDRMLEWLKSTYGVDEVHVNKDVETGDIWLNLDWWKDPKTRTDLSKHPGGPFFPANNHTPVYYSIEKESWTALTPVPEAPVASFSASKTDPNALENVTFDASGSYDPDTEIKAWEWDFGDGKKDIGKSVVHSFSKGGRYNVTLTITDNDEVEKSNQSTQPIMVNGLPIPVMDYTPKDPRLEDDIDFDASQSRDSDPEGSIKSYYWVFGDGETSPRRHPSPQKYESNGSYTVSLTVEDNKGAVNTTSTIIKVNLVPVAVMSIEPPKPPNQLHNTGEEVKFDASGSRDSDGNITKWIWDFGDGANSSGVLASHIFSDCGEFPVTLNVTDDNNASHNIEKILTINARPIANFTLDPPYPEEGIEITFDASSSKDPDGQISYYSWDLDESKTDGKRAIYADHKYKIAGEYNITLTVSDNRNAKNSMTRIIRVHPPNVDKLMQDGQVLINENRYQDAIYKFDSVLQQEPSNEGASFYKGFCLNKLGEYGDALKSLNASLAANPSNSYAWNEKANALSGLGRYEEALSSNNKSIELNPKLWFIWYDRGMLLYDMEEFDSAVNAYDNALSLNPSEDDKRDIIKMKDEASAKAPEPVVPSGIAKKEPSLAEKCSIDLTAYAFEFDNSTSVSFYGGESESAKQIRYKITVINNGDVSLHDVKATAEMAKGMKFYNAAYYEFGRVRLITEVSPSVFDETTKTKVTWNIEHLQANETRTILMNAYLKGDMNVDYSDISVNASGISSVCGPVWEKVNMAEIPLCELRDEFGGPCNPEQKEWGLCKLVCPEWTDQSI